MVRVLARKSGTLLAEVVFGDWIVFGLNAAALFVFRRRDAGKPVSFRAPLHPWSALVFMAAAASFAFRKFGLPIVSAWISVRAFTSV